MRCPCVEYYYFWLTCLLFFICASSNFLDSHFRKLLHKLLHNTGIETMGSHTSLSSGATASKKAPKFGQESFSVHVDNLCTMILTTSFTARILLPTQAPAATQMYFQQTKSLDVLSNGRRIGNGLETLT